MSNEIGLGYFLPTNSQHYSRRRPKRAQLWMMIHNTCQTAISMQKQYLNFLKSALKLRFKNATFRQNPDQCECKEYDMWFPAHENISQDLHAPLHHAGNIPS